MKGLNFLICCVAIAALKVSGFVTHAQTLGDALNATNLIWTTSGTGGAQGWGVQSNATHDGVSAAMSGGVTSSERSSILETTVTGPGTLSFWWRGRSPWHSLDFSVNNTKQTNINFSTTSAAWQQQVCYLGTGTHTLQWIYTNGVPTSDRGYLDEVSYSPGSTPSFIILQPRSQSQLAGMNTTFSVLASGTPPLSYRWQFNDVDILGATAASFTVTNVQATNLGVYRVVITNETGSVVSSNASLEFGEIAAWGTNQFGQVSVPIGATSIVAVAAGPSHSLALKADGTVIAWGQNNNGQTSVPEGLTNVVAVGAGIPNLALREDGTVVSWGGGGNMPSGLTNVVAIAAGSGHSLALKSDGTVTAWGGNLFGETNVPAGLTGVVAISAGRNGNSLALRKDGTVIAWGNNGFGLTNVPAGLTNAMVIEAGNTHDVAMKSDGTIVVWGGYYGFDLTNVPPTATNVVEIGAGYQHDLALRADGTIVAWGASSAGAADIPVGLSNVVAIAAGTYHSLALVGGGPRRQTAMVINPSCSAGVFTLPLPSQNGRVYELEYTDSLNDPEWTALPLAAGKGGTLVLTDSTANNAQRFYRVRRW